MIIYASNNMYFQKSSDTLDFIPTYTAKSSSDLLSNLFYSFLIVLMLNGSLMLFKMGKNSVVESEKSKTDKLSYLLLLIAYVIILFIINIFFKGEIIIILGYLFILLLFEIAYALIKKDMSFFKNFKGLSVLEIIVAVITYIGLIASSIFVLMYSNREYLALGALSPSTK